MSEPRPDLDELRRQYQVGDDRMTTYTPRVLGIPLADGRRMTQTEADLLDRLGLLELKQFKDISEDALAEAGRRFPPGKPPAHVPDGRRREWMGTDGHLDAFRHAYWNARLTQAFGEDWARAFTTAHEGVPGNKPTPEAMDLHNNAVGIRIGLANPDASPARLAALVETAVRNGEMVVVDKDGKLQWSDRVEVGQHGLAPRDEPVLDGKMRAPAVVDPAYARNDTSAPTRDDGTRHAQRLTDDPEVARHLAALQTQDPAAIREATLALAQSAAGERFLEARRARLAEQDARTAQPAPPERGPALG
ncbi:hypothetical protein [Xanthomonas sp. XNM01]|uniref:DUF6973 domain-containing protein n=1 Tax=Xanthomonas sp. XNM01 TaxID=2769289 RepID=UPI00177B7055|nr:hypothetical protein [Xanthomonas sp. XNM01]MBD9369245.1 hypothetical protein [Xanthomonas sp. XNM01]